MSDERVGETLRNQCLLRIALRFVHIYQIWVAFFVKKDYTYE